MDTKYNTGGHTQVSRQEAPPLHAAPGTYGQPTARQARSATAAGMGNRTRERNTQPDGGMGRSQGGGSGGEKSNRKNEARQQGGMRLTLAHSGAFCPRRCTDVRLSCSACTCSRLAGTRTSSVAPPSPSISLRTTAASVRALCERAGVQTCPTSQPLARGRQVPRPHNCTQQTWKTHLQLLTMLARARPVAAASTQRARMRSTEGPIRRRRCDNAVDGRAYARGKFQIPECNTSSGVDDRTRRRG